MRFVPGVAALAAGVGIAASGMAQGVIVDPENVPAGAIVDPENVPAGAIVDPENVPAGAIADPAPRTSFVPSTTFQGNADAGFWIDTAHQTADEDTLELATRVGLRVRHAFSQRWSATVEGALEYRATAGSDDAHDSVLAPDGDRWQGRIEPRLVDLTVAGRAGDWLLRMGHLVVAWGVSDFMQPADVINPRDLRAGLSSDPSQAVLAVPAVDATWIRGPVAWQFVVVPFYVGNRVDLWGSDAALAREGSPLAAQAPVGALAALIDPTLEEFAQPLASATRRPDETPENVSAGTRVTLRAGGADVSAGYFFGWDRMPSLQIAESLRGFLAALDPADPFAINGELLAVVADVDAGRDILVAAPERLHVVELDAVRYVGPVGLRFEVVFSPERTLYVEPLASVRRPVLSGALGVGWESSTGEAAIGAEAFGTWAFTEPGDPTFLLGSDRLGGVALGAQWDLNSVAPQSVLGRLRLRLGGVIVATHADALVTGEVGYDVGRSGEIVLSGAAVIDGEGPSDGVGDLYRGNDQIGVQYATVF